MNIDSLYEIFKLSNRIKFSLDLIERHLDSNKSISIKSKIDTLIEKLEPYFDKDKMVNLQLYIAYNQESNYKELKDELLILNPTLKKIAVYNFSKSA